MIVAQTVITIEKSLVSHLFWQVSTEDLLQLVNISPESALFKSLVGRIVIIFGTLCLRLLSKVNLFKNDVICPQASSIKDGEGMNAIIYGSFLP